MIAFIWTCNNYHLLCVIKYDITLGLCCTGSVIMISYKEYIIMLVAIV